MAHKNKSNISVQSGPRKILERAKAQGKVLGRPRVSPRVERQILKARKQGKGILRIARDVSCGTGTVQRVVKLLD